MKGSNLLDSAIHRPMQTVFGNDAYLSVYEKAAALFESIAQNHAFHNANKRTALTALIMFLKLNGYKWVMGIEEEQDFTVDVVNHKYTFAEMTTAIKEHTEKL